MKERYMLNATKLLERQRALHARQLYGGSSRGFSFLASSSSSSAHQKFEHQRGTGIHHHQLRFRRHDRASAFSKPRPPTRKKRGAYFRRMKKEADEKARQSAPGSKAGPRRQWAKKRWEHLLTYGKDDENNTLLPATQDEEYTYEDAILEDLMANTSNLTSQPTPEPIHLGHRHREFYNRVADQMDAYREAIDAQKSQNENDKSEDDNLPVSEPLVPLPSDQDVSKTLRAHRDRHGTRQNPIGIVRALEHLMQDLGVPVSAFGEYTYTTLMTCCRTPQEGRRIFKLMRDQNIEISSYSWSILVDIHAKVGDFEGCGEVLQKMASHGGHAPTQAAYTSLLAACYKICSDSGRNSHAVRAKAGTFGWKYWQEMRIIGIEPDVMAYGAILRLCAARGHPERAIGLLEDMQRFEVKPTTLCFTAALKSVARSHEISNRYQRGSSRRDMKRETITAHHGKMARQIIILAEAAEVQQDDGFTSALMLSAAAAGDSATAKAILLASEVRKMDHLRTIGGSRPEALDDRDSPLQLESGPESSENKRNSDAKDGCNLPGGIITEGALNKQSQNNEQRMSFGEREYGKDTRVISAFVYSCAQAVSKNGLGTIWAGKENLGYLCENSLRLIATRWEPSYRDTSVPGVNSTKVGIGALRSIDEREKDYEYTPGKRKKFRGLFIDEDDLATIDDFQEDDFDSDDEEGDDLFSDDTQYIESKDFENSMSEHKDEAQSSDEDFNFNDGDLHEDFALTDEEISELDIVNTKGEISDTEIDTEIEEIFNTMQNIDHTEALDDHSKVETSLDDEFDEQNSGSSESNNLIHQDHAISRTQEENTSLSNDFFNGMPDDALAGLDPIQISRIHDLQSVLPGMPLPRMKRILNAYDQNLGHPSMLTLVPILRETMPDYVSSGWLKRNNKQNADFALKKASEDGIVDSPLLNSMLQVKANAGSLNEAIEYHEEQFSKHKLTPSAYSDRLLLQMLVSNKRLARALEFKEKIEQEGRNLDIASYGSLIQFYSRHQQLGSAVLILKECMATHGVTPSEAYISDLRTLCKRKEVEDLVGLTGIVGKDPTEWLKHGQKNLKREKTKKGRRGIQQAQNRLL